MSCGFKGNLNELWQHAIETHAVKGQMQNRRVDGSQYVEDMWDGDEGHYTRPKGEIITNDKGEYIFECLEDHKHIWKAPREGQKLHEIYKYHSYCEVCNQGSYDLT